MTNNKLTLIYKIADEAYIGNNMPLKDYVSEILQELKEVSYIERLKNYINAKSENNIKITTVNDVNYNKDGLLTISYETEKSISNLLKNQIYLIAKSFTIMVKIIDNTDNEQPLTFNLTEVK